MKIDGPKNPWDWATLPNLAQSVRLVCSEPADLHSHPSSLGKWNGIAEIEVATSRLRSVKGVAPVFPAEAVLALPRLQAQQFGTGGGLLGSRLN